mgnify:CR=1 FL=1
MFPAKKAKPVPPAAAGKGGKGAGEKDKGAAHKMLDAMDSWARERQGQRNPGEEGEEGVEAEKLDLEALAENQPQLAERLRALADADDDDARAEAASALVGYLRTALAEVEEESAEEEPEDEDATALPPKKKALPVEGEE